ASSRRSGRNGPRRCRCWGASRATPFLLLLPAGLRSPSWLPADPAELRDFLARVACVLVRAPERAGDHTWLKQLQALEQPRERCPVAQRQWRGAALVPPASGFVHGLPLDLVRGVRDRQVAASRHRVEQVADDLRRLVVIRDEL